MPAQTPWRASSWPCSGWGLPSRPGHPGRWWSLAPPFHPYPAGGRAVCFLWHFPAGHPGLLLATTLPCGVRTFLGGRCARRGRPTGSSAAPMLPGGFWGVRCGCWCRSAVAGEWAPRGERVHCGGRVPSDGGALRRASGVACSGSGPARAAPGGDPPVANGYADVSRQDHFRIGRPGIRGGEGWSLPGAGRGPQECAEIHWAAQVVHGASRKDSQAGEDQRGSAGARGR